MEQDIIDRIEKDFKEDSKIALEKMTEFELDMNYGPRVSRCIIHLSEGSIEKLENLIQGAELSPSVVTLPAETFPGEFNEPFES